MSFKLEDAEDKSLIAVRSRVRREEIQHQLKLLAEGVSNTVLSLLIVMVLWVVALWAFNVTPYIGKGPLDVFNYMFLDESAAEHQLLIWNALGQTMIDAVIGFSFGLLFATLVAVLFTLSTDCDGPNTYSHFWSSAGNGGSDGRHCCSVSRFGEHCLWAPICNQRDAGCCNGLRSKQNRGT